MASQKCRILSIEAMIIITMEGVVVVMVEVEEVLEDSRRIIKIVISAALLLSHPNITMAAFNPKANLKQHKQLLIITIVPIIQLQVLPLLNSRQQLL